jgi:hypothetical protein
MTLGYQFHQYGLNIYFLNKEVDNVSTSIFFYLKGVILNMDFTIFLKEFFELCIFPSLLILGTFIVDWLRVKTEEIKQNTKSEKEKKYLDMIYNTIKVCVIATNQTYVDSLKKQGKFDAEAQKIAFQ